ncbi:MAG: hypothetical protein Q8P49_03915 [Candidatus Liptonbacteria bacterium]|nr:hypothetical protein [Candidatus Liptonbacteria bacterium]
MINKKKIWTLRFRAVDKKNFDELRRGLKTVETRAATERYGNIKKGDILRIVCGKKKLEKKVRWVRSFKSIAALTKEVPYKRIDPSLSSLAEVVRMYHSYPGYKEKIRKFGIVAMGV